MHPDCKYPDNVQSLRVEEHQTRQAATSLTDNKITGPESSLKSHSSPSSSQRCLGDTRCESSKAEGFGDSKEAKRREEDKNRVIQPGQSVLRHPNPGESVLRNTSVGESVLKHPRDPRAGESVLRHPSPGKRVLMHPTSGDSVWRHPRGGERVLRNPNPAAPNFFNIPNQHMPRFPADAALNNRHQPQSLFDGPTQFIQGQQDGYAPRYFQGQNQDIQGHRTHGPIPLQGKQMEGDPRGVQDQYHHPMPPHFMLGAPPAPAAPAHHHNMPQPLSSPSVKPLPVLAPKAQTNPIPVRPPPPPSASKQKGECSPAKVECRQCPRTFKSKGDLLKHEVVHNKGIRVYTCHMCDKHFKRPSNLKQHQGTFLHLTNAAKQNESQDLTKKDGPN